MNPALPLLAGLSLAGLLFRRRELGLAWAVSGLAGMLLLHGALTLRDGIPSPSASVSAIAPFAAVAVGGERGNPALRDVTFQIEPWLMFLRTELRSGRLPFWNPWQLGGAPFWSNGQAAPLFPLHLLFAVLPLQIGFVLLPWLRLAIGGTGAFAFARSLGVRRDAALLAAIAYPLSGMCASYLLFPMGSALALVPWVLWAAEGVTAGTLRWVVFASAVALQILAGHPETVLHTGLLVAIYVTVRAEWRRAEARLAVLRLVLGAAVAGLATAVAWVPVALLVRASARWQEVPGAEPALAVLLRLPLRVLLPQMFGHPAAGSWWGPFNYSATAVYVGVPALVLACAGARSRGADRRWRALLALSAFAALAAYHVPGVREVLASVPLVGRALPHRLLFGVELGLALLAAAGAEAWLAGRRRGQLLGVALIGAGLAVAWWLLGAGWAEHAQTRAMARASGWAAAVAVTLAASAQLPAGWRERLFAAVLALATVDLVVAHRGINPGLALSRLFPRTGALEFLAGRSERMAGIGETLRPNLAMAYGIADLRGDDPLRTRAFETIYATLSRPDATTFQPIEHWDAPWLDAMAVRWVLGPPASSPPRPEWRPVYRGHDAVVFERPTALPMVRWEGGGEEAALSIVRREPGRWDLAWSGAPAGARLVVAERAEPGWHVAAGSSAQALAASADGLLDVAVTATSGTASLRYRPPGIVAGLLLSLAGMAWLGVAARGRT